VLTAGELARWAWRQLTSMRVALILLLLLALAAVPGSLLPQNTVDPSKVAGFRRSNPALGAVFDKLSLFDVFSSPWFSAIYLLLVVSLVGCVVPRMRRQLRAARARPPAAPHDFGRLPEHRRWETEVTPAQVLSAAQEMLRRGRFRVDTDEGMVRAEKGHLREAGNLVFHLALVVVLVALAVGRMHGFRGSALVVEGEGFANTVTQYDIFDTGLLFDPASMAPFWFRLDDFRATYQESGRQRGAPVTFDADLTYTATAGGSQSRFRVRVNHPLEVAGTKVFLTGHGYAPVVSVRDGSGRLVFSGAVPFLPQDLRNFGSEGVIKVPDAQPEQLGFSGFFLPTAAVDRQLGPISVFPQALNPAVFLQAWKGDLGLDSGLPQSVYRLDTSRLTRVMENGSPFARALRPGQTMTLPDHLGSLTFEGYREWAIFQIARDPGKELALVGAALAVVSLLASLFVRPRRVWIRASASDGRTSVELGAFARSRAQGLTAEVERIVETLQAAAPRREVVLVSKED
jgi:cytochrome c biogenesis protein